ncbi:basement membrane-specific heparan sulfate proteoglycan core protein-like isoform X1 [Poecilia formosa]|uniref:basement membrane-specific heparan sulfate proteoglycan core protein-like isoform X1 n=1 Tax=Poecilia formosa TaxID=48698 RepID=UPI0007B9D61F|nr:PREDICTED: basement membrane-specific heparan sulfate proteoglycan core protein-like isoform X1 [Poecilia formosa]
MGHISLCVLGFFWLGTHFAGWAEADEPRATLTADRTIIPLGGSVTLTCSVDGSDDWKFDWFRNGQQYSADLIRGNTEPFRVSEGGVYSCRGGRGGKGDPVFQTETSNEVSIQKTVSKPTVTLQPNWPVYRGETVTLRCEIQRGEGTQWTYEWRTTIRNSPTSSEYKINRVSEYDSGEYRCMAKRGRQLTDWSDAFRLTVRSDKPRATLTADRTTIPLGGSITLTCSVDKSVDWKFDWFRNGQQYSVGRIRGNTEPSGTISVSEGRVYSCRGGRGDPVFQTETSNEVPIQKTVSKPTVTLHPNWPVYRGETVTLRCEIQRGEGTQWTYEWRTTIRNSATSSEYRINRVSESDRGEYRCKAKRGLQLTEWSDAFRLTVRSDKPRATLTADRTVIPLGGSITLTCSVDGSDDWKFDWFRNGRQYSVGRIRGNTEPYRVISVSEGGVYSCRGGRERGGGGGDPVFQTETSNEVPIQKTVSKPTVTLQPTWPVIYRGETVTLRCEIQDDGGTQWTYEWRPTNRNSPTSSEYRINRVSEYDNGEYRCKAKRGRQLTDWSDAFRLTVRSDKPRATVTAHRTTIPAGGSVTLSCSVEGSGDWKFDWFRNGQQYPVDQIRVISVSEGGEYSCRGQRGNPVFQTEKSREVSIQKTVSRPTVTLQPNWPVVFRGETVTLRCEIQGGGGTQWKYEWIPANRNSPSSSEYRISSVSDSDGRNYCCKAHSDHQITNWSSAFRLTVDGNRPTPSLTAKNYNIPAGGSVALSCSVRGSAGWRFDWFRQESVHHSAQSIRNNESSGTISVSNEGVYSCRGGRGDPVFYTETSSEVTIQKTVPITPTVIQQPNWSQIYRGEKVTLRCEIQGGTQWTYEWRTTNRNSPSSSEYRITADSSGDYGCRGRRDRFTLTEWRVIRLNVSSPKPQPVLSVSPSWLNPGASVTLSCEVKHQDAGWRFFWYKAVSKLISSSYSLELLPGSTNGTEQNSFIIQGQNHTAGFVCRAGRGEPEFYTYYSEPKFVWSADSHPAASLSVSPDRVQHVIDQPVTLKCSGNDTKWRVRRFTDTTSPSHVQCSNWGTMHGSSCTINRLWYHSGVYWCESESGEFSNAVNITVQDNDYDGIILLSPVHPVTEGDPVTLSCRNKEQQLLSNVFFYHNDKLLHSDSREELNISAVSKSDEGFYKCQHSGKDSPRSWMSVRVTVSSPVSPSSPLLLIIGPISGIILIIFLLLLWRYRQPKDLCSFRSDKNNRRSTTDHGAENEISSPSQDAALYESVKPSEATAAEPREITYAIIKFKKLRKKKKPRKPEERVIYAEVKTRAEELAPTYAEINKNKAKQDRKEEPAATDESVYSEIKSVSALDDESAL